MRRLPEVLHDVAFRRFWIGQSVSLVGDQISLLAIPLVGVLALQASPVQMGYLFAAGLVPSLVLSLVAGAWLDRRGRRRRHMIIADCGRAAALATIPIAVWLHALSLLQLYVVAFVIGSFDVIFFVAYSSLFTSLVQPHEYVTANGLLNGSRAGAEVVGQSAAGGIIALLTAPLALLTDASTCLVSAVFLSAIHPEESPASERNASRVWDGARFIRRSDVVQRLLAVSATLNFFNFMFSAVFVLFVVTRLGVGPAALGLVLGIGSIGTLLGSLFAGPVIRGLGVGRSYRVGSIAFPGPLLVIPLAPARSPLTYVLVGAAEFASGIGLMLFDITAGSIQAAAVPGRLRARVAGAYRTVNYGVRPLGSLAGGFAGAAIGLRPTLLIGGLGATCCALWLIRSRLVGLVHLDSATEERTQVGCFAGDNL